MAYKIGVVIENPDDVAVSLRRCIELAERAGGSIHVIDVTEPTPRWLLGARRKDTAEVERLRERRALMERFVSNVRSGTVEFTVAARSGRRIVELVGELRQAGVDLVVLVSGDVSLSPTTAEAFANRVVRKSPVPVLVLRPLVSVGSGTVIAVDVSDAEGSDALIDSIMTQGLRLTAADAPITVIHVLDLPVRAAVSDAAVAEAARSAVTTCRAKLERLVADHDRSGDVSVVVRVGRPVAEIAAVTQERRPELLVVGTVSRSGPAGLIVGNTAEALLREVACSVLAVKPADFRSPLV